MIASIANPIAHSQIDINLRVRIEQRDHSIDHRPARVHYVQTQPRVPDKYVLKEQWSGQARPLFCHS